MLLYSKLNLEYKNTDLQDEKNPRKCIENNILC